MNEKWKKLVADIEEFLYGERGIETTAYSDRNLNTYILDRQQVINILKQIKKIEKELSKEQIKDLEYYKNAFLEIDNGKNGINEIFREIVNIYKNIEIY